MIAATTSTPPSILERIVHRFDADVTALGGTLSVDPTTTSLVATFSKPEAGAVAASILQPRLSGFDLRVTGQSSDARIGAADAVAAIKLLDGVTSADALGALNMLPVMTNDAASAARLGELLRPQIAGLDVHVGVEESPEIIGWGSGIG